MGIGNGGASAWDGSREFDPEHWDLRFKLHAEHVNDPSGTYIRQWVPELRSVDDKFIHTPWLMSEEDMEACGCVLGRDYPVSLVGQLDVAEKPYWEQVEKKYEPDLSLAEYKEMLAAKDKELEELRKAAGRVGVAA